MSRDIEMAGATGRGAPRPERDSIQALAADIAAGREPYVPQTGAYARKKGAAQQQRASRCSPRPGSVAILRALRMHFLQGKPASARASGTLSTVSSAEDRLTGSRPVNGTLQHGDVGDAPKRQRDGGRTPTGTDVGNTTSAPLLRSGRKLKPIRSDGHADLAMRVSTVALEPESSSSDSSSEEDDSEGDTGEEIAAIRALSAMVGRGSSSSKLLPPVPGSPQAPRVSIYRGVYPVDGQRHTWRAEHMLDDFKLDLGLSKDEQVCAARYDAACFRANMPDDAVNRDIAVRHKRPTAAWRVPALDRLVDAGSGGRTGIFYTREHPTFVGVHERRCSPGERRWEARTSFGASEYIIGSFRTAKQAATAHDFVCVRTGR